MRNYLLYTLHIFYGIAFFDVQLSAKMCLKFIFRLRRFFSTVRSSHLSFHGAPYAPFFTWMNTYFLYYVLNFLPIRHSILISIRNLVTYIWFLDCSHLMNTHNINLLLPFSCTRKSLICPYSEFAVDVWPHLIRYNTKCMNCYLLISSDKLINFIYIWRSKAHSLPTS